MRIATIAVAVGCAAGAPVLAQRPSDPALLVPQQAPELDMTAVLDPLPIPAGMTMGAPAAVAFDARGPSVRADPRRPGLLGVRRQGRLRPNVRGSIHPCPRPADRS